jgi:hypothetical protein
MNFSHFKATLKIIIFTHDLMIRFRGNFSHHKQTIRWIFDAENWHFLWTKKFFPKRRERERDSESGKTIMKMRKFDKHKSGEKKKKWQINNKAKWSFSIICGNFFWPFFLSRPKSPDLYRVVCVLSCRKNYQIFPSRSWILFAFLFAKKTFSPIAHKIINCFRHSRCLLHTFYVDLSRFFICHHLR